MLPSVADLLKVSIINRWLNFIRYFFMYRDGQKSYFHCEYDELHGLILKIESLRLANISLHWCCCIPPFIHCHISVFFYFLKELSAILFSASHLILRQEKAEWHQLLQLNSVGVLMGHRFTESLFCCLFKSIQSWTLSLWGPCSCFYILQILKLANEKI